MKNSTEHTNKTSDTSIDYLSLTHAAKKEISRLVALSKSIQTNRDNPEIYSEWAYGVFLFWKNLAGRQVTPADLLGLEMLATGEQQI
jgi:spermidine synthase